MFIPIGLGNFPARFPLGIALLLLINIIWSENFFATLKNLQKNEEHIGNDYKNNLRAAIISVCNMKFKNDAVFCNNISNNMNTHSEQENRSKKLIEKNKNFSPQKQPSTNLYPSSNQDGNKDVNIDVLSGIKAELLSANEKMTFILRHQNDIKNWPAESRTTPEYKILLQSFTEQQNRLSAKMHEQGMFTKHGGILHALQASFTHQNMMHLTSNMLYLFLFGIWVEFSLGFFSVIAIYLVASVLGLASELYLGSAISILGASAGVMGLMGAYFMLFFRAESAFIFFSIFFGFRKIFIPTLWIFPFFYIVSQLAGYLWQQDNVAYLAHLTGLMVGILIAYLCKKLFHLKDNFYFANEIKFKNTISSSHAFNKNFQSFKKILTINPQNWKFCFNFMNEFPKEFSAGIHNFISDEDSKWLDTELQHLINFYLKRKSVAEVIQCLLLLQPYFNLNLFFRETSLSQLLFLAEQASHKNNYSLAAVLYRSCLPKKMTKVTASLIQNNLTSIEGHLASINGEKSTCIA